MKKSYTDLEQCKKLAEILPLDSADMSYTLEFDSGKYYISTTSYKSWVVPKYAESYKGLNQVLPCWSLSELLSILQNYTLQTTSNRKVFVVCDNEKPIISAICNNPVDACVDVIIKRQKIQYESTHRSRTK